MGLVTSCLPPFAPATAVQVAGAPGEAFLSVSKVLTGRTLLDAGHAGRLEEAFTSINPRFVNDVQALSTLVQDRNLDPSQLQQVLDLENSPLASLPRMIMSAWYTGVVGEGAAARCVTFEMSLMHQLVADRLNPPSYCYGPYGSWSEAPA